MTWRASLLTVMVASACQPTYVSPEEVVVEAARDDALTCFDVDLVVDGTIDMADFLALSADFGGTTDDGLPLDMAFFLAQSAFFGQDCGAPGWLFTTREEVDAHAAVSFSDLYDQGAVALTDAQYDALFDGELVLGAAPLDTPVVHPDGSFEVAPGVWDDVEAYAAQYGETGDAYELRLFEGMVLHGLYDPAMPAFDGIADAYLNGDAPSSYRSGSSSCTGLCFVLRMRGADEQSVTMEGTTCELDWHEDDYYIIAAECSDVDVGSAGGGKLELTSTCSKAYDTRLVCHFTPSEPGACEQASCEVEVEYGGGSWAMANGAVDYVHIVQNPPQGYVNASYGDFTGDVHATAAIDLPQGADLDAFSEAKSHVHGGEPADDWLERVSCSTTFGVSASTGSAPSASVGTSCTYNWFDSDDLSGGAPQKASWDGRYEFGETTGRAAVSGHHQIDATEANASIELAPVNGGNGTVPLHQSVRLGEISVRTTVKLHGEQGQAGSGHEGGGGMAEGGADAYAFVVLDEMRTRDGDETGLGVPLTCGFAERDAQRLQGRFKEWEESIFLDGRGLAVTCSPDVTPEVQ